MFKDWQLSLGWDDALTLPKKLIILKEIINDRNSKYSVVGIHIESLEDVKSMYAYLKKDPYFRDATHNSYAYRLKLESWAITEGKNDDGETWAGMCILREIQRANGVNTMLVVTRYFWGIKLQNDRYKHVIDACKIFFEKINPSTHTKTKS